MTIVAANAQTPIDKPPFQGATLEANAAYLRLMLALSPQRGLLLTAEVGNSGAILVLWPPRQEERDGIDKEFHIVCQHDGVIVQRVFEHDRQCGQDVPLDPDDSSQLILAKSILNELTDEAQAWAAAEKFRNMNRFLGQLSRGGRLRVRSK